MASGWSAFLPGSHGPHRYASIQIAFLQEKCFVDGQMKLRDQNSICWPSFVPQEVKPCDCD